MLLVHNHASNIHSITSGTNVRQEHDHKVHYLIDLTFHISYQEIKQKSNRFVCATEQAYFLFPIIHMKSTP